MAYASRRAGRGWGHALMNVQQSRGGVSQGSSEEPDQQEAGGVDRGVDTDQ